MEALALAERLDLHRARLRGDHHPERPEEGRAEGGAARGAGDAVARAEEAGRRPGRAARPVPAGPLVRGLGRVRRGRAVVPQRDRPGRRGRAAVRAVRLRVPRGSWPGSRWSRAGGTTLLELTDLRQESPPPIPRAMLDALRMTRRAGPRRRRRGRARALRRFWAREGAVAIHSAALEMVAGRPRGDAAGRDPGVRRRGRACSAGSGTSGSAPGSGSAAVAIGAVAHAMPTLSAAERATYARAGRADPRRRARRRSSATPTRPATGARRAGPG